MIDRPTCLAGAGAVVLAAPSRLLGWPTPELANYVKGMEPTGGAIPPEGC